MTSGLFGKDVEVQPVNQINITGTKFTISNLHLSTFENPTLSDNVHIEVKAENFAEENCDQKLDEKDKELASLKMKQLIFEKAPYANIITDAKGKILEVNNAAVKMFGYSPEEITSIKTRYLFEITEEVYENSLNERRLLGTINRVRTGLTKDGKTFPCEISSVIFVTDEGEERAITTIIDISERVEKQDILDANQILNTLENTIKEKLKVERLLEENNERIKHIFNSSSDVLYDFDLLTNIVSVSDGFEKKFGYKITNNMTDAHYWLSHIYHDDRDSVVNDFNAVLASHENKWIKQYRFLSADVSVAEVISNGSIMRNKEGKAIRIIGSLQNLTQEKLLAETVEQKNKEKLRETLNSSPDVLWDLDLVTNELIVNNAYENLFGHTLSQNFNLEEWLAHIHPDDKEAAKQEFYRIEESSETKKIFSYKFFKADGSVADLVTQSTIIRNSEGKAVRLMGTTHDVTKQKELEKNLEFERKMKEKQIAEAIIDAHEEERVELSKELHDNVNQLLGAAKLYNDMAQKNGVNRENLLQKSSAYTLMAIEEIRKISKGLVSSSIAEVGLVETIKNLAEEIMEAHQINIKCATHNCCEDPMNNKFKLNVYRIVQEQLNNIVKHSKASEVIINFTQSEPEFVISISDNGIGFDTSKPRKGLGINNIISRAALYKCKANFISKPGNGCVLSLNFNYPHISDNKKMNDETIEHS